MDSRTSLAVMYRLAESGKLELGRRFDVFTNEFRGIHSDNAEEVRSQVVGIARCLGIYRRIRYVRCDGLRNSTSPRDSGTTGLICPGLQPSLDAYIDTLVKFGFSDKWKRLT